MNARQRESANAWLVSWKQQKKPILLLTGASASGKTTLAFSLLEKMVVVEFSGFDQKIGRRLKLMAADTGAKTVAEYAGSSYGPKPNAIVIEDLDFCDASSARAVVQFARSMIMPIVCTVSTQRQLEHSLTELSVQVRMYRPTPKIATEILMGTVDHLKNDPKLASKIVERSNCDIRQARIEASLISMTGFDGGLKEGVDAEAPNIFDAVPMLYPSRGLQGAIKIADLEDPLMDMMVAENYHKEKGATLGGMAAAAEDVSTADTLSRHCPEVSHIFGIVGPTLGRKGLASRAVFPSVLSRLSTEASNKKKLANLPGLDYTSLEAVDRRIVQTLDRGAPAERVAREMNSMGLTRIEQWETVRTLSSMKREPAKVHASKKDALRKALLQ